MASQRRENEYEYHFIEHEHENGTKDVGKDEDEIRGKAAGKTNRLAQAVFKLGACMATQAAARVKHNTVHLFV